MDFNVIIQLIGAVGFPIVMCLMMFNRMEKQDEDFRNTMTEITKSINNNTNALTILAIKLGEEDVMEDAKS